MGRRKKGEPPAYRRHKSSNLAYVTIGGKPIYLGAYGSPESRRRYRAIIREWEDSAGRAELPPLPLRRGCTVETLTASFLDFAKAEYRMDGESTSSYRKFRHIVRDLNAALGDYLADDVRSPDILALRSRWIAAGLSRGSVNDYISKTRQIFAWGMEQGLVDATTLVAVTVKGLAVGRTEAQETEGVSAAVEEHVLAVAAKLGGVLEAMIRLQNVVGMRPGEVCRMRGGEIDRDGKVYVRKGKRMRIIQLRDKNGKPATCWVFQPGRFKTRHHGKTLAYVLGPKARLLLAPWLKDDPGEYLFPSRQAPHYSTSSYNTRVRETCDALGVPRWSANMLRHSVSTYYDQQAGLLLASKIMGHARPETTLGYIEENLQEVYEMVEKHG